MPYYKILNADGESTYQDFKWPLPRKQKDGTYKPGKWLTAKGELGLCVNGFHLTDKPFAWYEWGCKCYEAEHRGEVIEGDDKICCREARLLHPVPHPQWWLDAQAFVRSIGEIRFLKPDGRPPKKWRIFETWAAARAAVRAAANQWLINAWKGGPK